jgi:hypothetical protein
MGMESEVLAVAVGATCATISGKWEDTAVEPIYAINETSSQ